MSVQFYGPYKVVGLAEPGVSLSDWLVGWKNQPNLCPMIKTENEDDCNPGSM